jgi:NDP-sugar pyrophosphorylase family protein
VIGDDCVVGHATEVKHSILLNHVAAAHFNYVGDSILGNHVNLGAGVKCANVKMNSGSVFVHWGNEKIDTGLLKLGALVGDGVRVGCNCVTNPGTILEKNSVCYPCLSIQGVVRSTMKNRVE